MLQEKKSRTGTVVGLVFAAVMLLLVIVLENTLDLPSGHVLYSVLKKGAVYSLVAVSMNLLNGFTGLFGEKATDKV